VDEISIEEARPKLGDIVDRARPAGQSTVITRHGKPAAVLMSAGDGRRLAAIRDVLARFDWEHDDRQLALERIERIADGGQS